VLNVRAQQSCNLGKIVVLAGKLHVYSHYLTHITRSQFEIEAGLMK